MLSNTTHNYFPTLFAMDKHCGCFKFERVEVPQKGATTVNLTAEFKFAAFCSSSSSLVYSRKILVIMLSHLGVSNGGFKRFWKGVDSIAHKIKWFG